MILWFWFFLFCCLKIVFAWNLPLSPDEAYYWVWGQNLQLSYFDHPPFVSYLFFLSEKVSPGFPRLLGVLTHFATLAVWWAILRNHFQERKLILCLLLISLSPLVGFGGWIITPDIPLLFFWSLSTLLFLRYLKEPSSALAALLGLSVGFGFLSKYQMILFVLAVVLFLFRAKLWTRQRLLHVLLCTLVATVVFFPVLYWNLLNDWASFKFQTKHGLGATHWDPWWTLSYLIAQIVLLYPPFIRKVASASVPKNFQFFWELTLVPLSFFLFTSFRGVVEINWPLMAHFSFFCLVLFAVHNEKTLLRPLLVWFFLELALWTNALFPWIPNPPDKLNELTKFSPVVDEFLQPETYGSSYQMTSWVWATTKKPCFKLPGMSRFDFFDFLVPEKPLASRFRLVQEKDTQIPDWLNPKDFEIKALKSIGKHFEVWEITRK